MVLFADRIDGIQSSVAVKAPVRVATTGPITAFGLQTIDGVALSEGGNGVPPDRVLRKNETNPVNNGIFDVSTSAWTRSKDFDGARDVVQGTLIPVYGGAINRGSIWQCTAANPVLIGVSDLTFVVAIENILQANGIVSLLQFGGVGDGIVNNDVALALAEASTATTIYVPDGTFLASTTTAASLTKNYFGPGQLKTGSNKRGKYFSNIASAPTSVGNTSSVDTAFNGDLTNQIFTIEHRVTGTDTLGTAAEILSAGYVQKNEAGPMWIYMDVDSGRTDNSVNGTGVAGVSVFANNRSANGGVAIGGCFNASANAARTPTGAFDRTAANCLTGATFAGVDNVYLNTLEFNTDDQGHDVTGIGLVLNMNRTNNTAAHSGFWAAVRPTSNGSQACDVGYTLLGTWSYGIDLTKATYNQAAIAIKANDGIFFNATAGANYASGRGTTSINYDSASGKFLINVGGVVTAQFDNAGGIYAGTAFKVNGVQVLQGRDTGWAAMTGTTNKNTVYDTATVTTAQLAGRVMALQAALTAHGVIGT